MFAFALVAIGVCTLVTLIIMILPPERRTGVGVRSFLNPKSTDHFDQDTDRYRKKN